MYIWNSLLQAAYGGCTKTKPKTVSGNFMRHYIITFLILSFNLCSSQTRLDSMIAKLQQPYYFSIYKVKDSIVSYQKEAIPKLIELLKDTSFVKLENTADLIYPGAEKYYGHGWIVNYDIDWISVRASWLLEEITFQNFGYRDSTINEDKLMSLFKHNYNLYLQTGSLEIDFKDKTPRHQLVMYRLKLADSVSKWWEKNKNTWTRFGALKEALANVDEQRQGLALHYLRFEQTLCEGLTLENYINEIKPLVQKIEQSKNSKAEQAKYLLDDNQYYWFKSKKSSR